MDSLVKVENRPKPSVVIKGTIRFIPAKETSKVISALMIHLNKYYLHVPVIVRYDVDFEPTYDKAIEFELTGVGERPTTYDDALIVRVFTKRAGIQRIPAWVAEGWSYWSLHKLEKDLESKKNAQKVYHSEARMHVVETTVESAKPIGVIELSISQLNLSQPDFFARERVTRLVRTNYAAQIEKHLANEQKMEANLLIVKTNSNRIRMIEYLSDVAQRSGRMPCFAFLYGPIVQSSIDYWLRCLSMIQTRGDMKAYAHLQPLTQDAILAVKLVTLAPQWMEYVPDIFYTADGSSIDTDYFADAMVLLSDDCDGLTKAILMGTLSFLELYRKYKLPDQLRILADLLQYYVPIATLCGTSSASAAAFGAKKISGAHFAMLFLPLDYYTDCVQRANPTHPLVAFSKSVPTQLKGSLPVLYGEGTGRIEPYGIEDPAATARDIVCSPEIEQFGRTDIFYPRNKDAHFVIWVISGITRYFTDGIAGNRCNVGSFYFSHKTNGGQARGVAFSSVINRSNEVMILPTDLYTDDELIYVQTECTLCPPVVSLVPSRNPKLPLVDTELEKLNLELRKLHVQKRPPNKEVNLYIRRENLNALFYSLLRETLLSQSEVMGLKYSTEHVLTNLEGRVITVFVST